MKNVLREWKGCRINIAHLQIKRRMTELECHTLSAEGIRSYDYVKWKEETLANQTSHKVGQNYQYLIPSLAGLSSCAGSEANL